MSAEDVANAFVNHYYTTLGSAPQNLIGLYVCVFVYFNMQIVDIFAMLYSKMVLH